MATISNPYTLTDYVLLKNLSSSGLTVNGSNDWSLTTYNGWCASNIGQSLSTYTAIFSFVINPISGSSPGYEFFIAFERITNLRSRCHLRCNKLIPGVEYTVLINYNNGTCRFMENGKYVNFAKKDIGFFYLNSGSGDSWSNKWVISLSGTGRVKFDSLKYAVNLPDNTVMNYIEDELYLKGSEIYGMNNGTLIRLHSDWNSLSDADKVSMFTSTNHEIATSSKLSTLGNFKILNLNETNYLPSHSITAISPDQLILPKGMISLDSFEGIDKATLTTNVSQNAKCKILITTDQTAYQTYDFVNQLWQIVDHTDLTQVVSLGIDSTQLPNIPRAAWDTLTVGKTGVGFAYLLSIEDTTDNCNIDKLELTVDMKGAWNMPIPGTDYSYGYTKNNILSVNLLTNGDYKINYSEG